jgi:hypothetical protein
MPTDINVKNLAREMHFCAVLRVGGETAWGRMTAEAQDDIYAAEAWYRTYGRWDEGVEKVTVEDVALAYASLTSRAS